MRYGLYKKKLGVLSGTLVKEFKSENEIKDFVFLDKQGFYFITDSPFISYLDMDGKFKESFAVLSLDKYKLLPTSIVKNASNRFMYVILGFGYDIVEIENLNSVGLSRSLFGRTTKLEVDRLFSKCPKVGDFFISADIDAEGNIYISNSITNSCYKYNRDTLLKFAGGDKRGFATSNVLEKCLFDTPMGICCCGESIYVADSGNKCIRVIKGGRTFIACGGKVGNDSVKICKPCLLRASNNIIYYIDGDRIMYLTISNNFIGQIHQSKNLVSIATSSDRSIFYLETLDGI